MKRKVWVLAFLSAALASCQAPQDNGKGQEEEINTVSEPFTDEEPVEFATAVVIDDSPSMRSLGAEIFGSMDGMLHKMYRDRAGSNDRIVLSLITGTKAPLLFDGKPSSFRKKFQSQQVLERFIYAVPDPGGSRVYDTLSDSIEYMLKFHNRSGGKCNTLLVAYTDMEDTCGGDKARLISNLKTYHAKGGSVGLYYVDRQYLGEWERVLGTDIGFPPGRYHVSSKIEQDSLQPKFDN